MLNVEAQERSDVETLKNEVCMLKKVQKTQARILKVRQKVRQKERDDEMDALKEENKKLENVFYDLLKASDAHKENVKMICNLDVVLLLCSNDEPLSELCVFTCNSLLLFSCGDGEQ
jgi:hypothetical protein